MSLGGFALDLIISAVVALIGWVATQTGSRVPAALDHAATLSATSTCRETSGRVTVTVVPDPGPLSMTNVPPCSSTTDLAKGSPEPGALMLAVENRIDPVEGLHYERDILGADPYSGVTDANSQRRLIDLARYVYPPPRRREFDRVADQIDKHLFQLDRVAFEHRPGRPGPIDDDLDLGCFCGRSQHRQLSVIKVPGCVGTRSICNLPASTLARSSISSTSESRCMPLS